MIEAPRRDTREAPHRPSASRSAEPDVRGWARRRRRQSRRPARGGGPLRRCGDPSEAARSAGGARPRRRCSRCVRVRRAVCSTTGSIGVSSYARSAGRMNGTSIPSDRPRAAIVLESVERTNLSIAPDAVAASRARSISVIPASRRSFFPGMPFDPPRAGIKPRIRRVMQARRSGRRESRRRTARLRRPPVTRLGRGSTGLQT